jgi:undecaprenyl diphosphate synthase
MAAPVSAPPEPRSEGALRNADGLDLSQQTIPTHVGIIMDGNGRWAEARGKRRTDGHLEGLTAAKATVGYAVTAGIRYLSLYTFSTENWRRVAEEVRFIMGLVAKHLRNEYDFYRENRIRVVHSGDMGRLPPEVQTEIRDVIRDTAEFDQLTVNLALNYGGRDEIVRAVNRWIRENGEGPLDETGIERYLDQPQLPAPDLIIRTGGERRLSNFLIWEAAYAELYFTNVLWPDFGPQEFADAVEEFSRRVRRFGGS